nr:probable phospholipid-transporting ATPase IM [Leptinotarsa decemlineata]
MDYELEVFEVYDDSEQQSSKRHSKHTRKKCKQKQKSTVLSIESTDNDISRSKTSVVGSDRKHLSLCESILGVFSKLFWRNPKRYQSTVPDRNDIAHSSKDFRKGYMLCDNQRRIHANDRVYNSQFHYSSNYIKTSKYSLLTFLPLNLFEQFQRLANFYFLCLLVLQLIPAISSLTPVTTALPLIGVLGLTAIKDAYDDIQRHISDSHVNNRKSRVVRKGKLVNEKWSAVQVGDIVRMDNNSFIAADLLILTSSEPNGLCYIETSELDGETNLKCRQCLVETTEMGQDDTLLGEFDGEIMCELPNNLLNKFEGVLLWKGRSFPLDNEKIMLRGCVLRNTQWCYGVVIFAGKDTKLMQNSGKSKFKRTSIDRLLNFLIIGIVFFLLSMCLFCMVACGIWETLVGQYFQTFLPWDTLVPSEPMGGATIIALLVFFSYAIVLNTVVPISLYVSVEVIRFVQSFLINWDDQMYYEKTGTHAKARTTTLNEELGQIEYIFSDKTGTLTQNIMTFNKCSIGGRSYGDVIDQRTGDVIEITEDTEPLDFSFNPNYECEFRFYDKHLLEAVRRRDAEAFSFFRLLALCHTVMSEERDGRLEYQAQSPDEAALVSAARNFGFVFKERSPNSITIEVMGVKEVYELLCILDFNNIRKRMSVILRKDGQLKLYCKGADNVIYERLKSGSEDFKNKTQEHLNKFAGEGLRTLCLASCDLNEEFFNNWKQRHQEAAISMEGRDEKLDAIYEEIERDMDLIGVTAIEDKLQDGVPQTIANLILAGIKIWVLTGDKQETAINIGYSCQLLTDDLVDIFIVDASSYDEVHQQLLKFRENIKIVHKFQPRSPQAATVPAANQAPNGRVHTAERAPDASAPRQTNPPAISVVTFRFDDDIQNGDNTRASTELEYYGGTEEHHEESSAGFAIVINGHSLVHCLHPQMERLFLEIVMQCKSVICCRVTPLQKALVVELVKKSRHAVTLAIGDGANDVSMIKGTYYDAVSPNGQGLSDYMLFCSVTAAILVIVNSAQIALDTMYWTVINHVMIWGSLAFYFLADNFYNYVFNGPYVGSLTKAMSGANFWFTTVLVVIISIMPVLAWRFYFVDVFPTLSDRVRLKQRMAQVRSRQSQDVLRTPSARRARRSIRSGYAFAHQEGFGRLITSGKIMRKLPNPEFNIPNIINKLNMNSGGSNAGHPHKNTASTPPPTQESSSSGSSRAPIQDLDTINL